jgi:serine/threonine protein kinase
MERIVGGCFRLTRRIGAGSFGEIYSAENIQTHRRVAVKLENVRSRVPQLRYEAKLYQIFQGGTGIPRLFWHGAEDLHNIMVIELLGKSLEDLFVKCHRRFTLKTVLMLADQMLSCV